MDEAAGLRAESAVRKWSQGAGERRLCIKGWRVLWASGVFGAGERRPLHKGLAGAARLRGKPRRAGANAGWRLVDRCLRTGDE